MRYLRTRGLAGPSDSEKLEEAERVFKKEFFRAGAVVDGDGGDGDANGDEEDDETFFMDLVQNWGDFRPRRK